MRSDRRHLHILCLQIENILKYLLSIVQSFPIESCSFALILIGTLLGDTRDVLR